MNKLALALLSLTLSLHAEQPAPPPTPMAPPPAPPVTVAPSQPLPGEVTAIVVTNNVIVTNVIPVTSVVLVTNPIPQPQFVYDQKVMGGRAPLVTPDQARTLIEIFRTNYTKLGSPRFLIYVNRELVDESAGMKIAGRTEHTEHIKGQPGETQKAVNENSYKFQDRSQLSVGDRQTVRDIERVFARPLRMAGASFADQKVATQILEGRDIKDFVTPVEGDGARKDREALGKISDVVIEVLYSYKNATFARISGDQTYSIPNIQVTAIRLTDSKLLGQASSDDLLKGNQMPYAYDISEVTEATSLALMQDLLLSVP